MPFSTSVAFTSYLLCRRYFIHPEQRTVDILGFISRKSSRNGVSGNAAVWPGIGARFPEATVTGVM